MINHLRNSLKICYSLHFKRIWKGRRYRSTCTKQTERDIGSRLKSQFFWSFPPIQTISYWMCFFKVFSWFSSLSWDFKMYLFGIYLDYAFFWKCSSLILFIRKSIQPEWGLGGPSAGKFIVAFTKKISQIWNSVSFNILSY